MKDDAFDREITEKFADTYAEIRAGHREHWLDNPHGRLAYVIVLDQFARNMFRGTARVRRRQAGGGRRRRGRRARRRRGLGANERWFLYMPFMHAEDRALQERSVALFNALAASAPPELRGALARVRQIRRAAPRHHRALRPLPAPQRRGRARKHARRDRIPQAAGERLLGVRAAGRFCGFFFTVATNAMLQSTHADSARALAYPAGAT